MDDLEVPPWIGNLHMGKIMKRPFGLENKTSEAAPIHGNLSVTKKSFGKSWAKEHMKNTVFWGLAKKCACKERNRSR